MDEQKVRKFNNDEFKEFYLVWTKPDPSIPKSSSSPHKSYSKLYQAVGVCKAMAASHPGKKFFVLKAVHREMTPRD